MRTDQKFIIFTIILIFFNFHVFFTIHITNQKLKKEIMTNHKRNEKKLKEILLNTKLKGDKLDYFYPNFYQKSKIGACKYTLVSQLSFARLDRILLQQEHWNECISIGFFMNIKEFNEKFDNLFQLFDLFDSQFSNSKHLNIHLHISDQYKINTLRNLSLDYSTSKYVLIIDIDWIVSKNIHEIIDKFGPPKSKQVFCLMTFDMKCPDLYPSLKTCNITDFYPHGQHLTNYDKWIQSNVLYEINYSFPYEPYVFMKRNQVPRYRTRFDFGGNDKVSHFFEIGLMDFKFFVLPKCFVSHYPHLHVENWGTRSYERAVELWHEYIKELRLLFPHKEIRDNYLKWNSKCSLKTCTKEELQTNQQ